MGFQRYKTLKIKYNLKGKDSHITLHNSDMMETQVVGGISNAKTRKLN